MKYFVNCIGSDGATRVEIQLYVFHPLVDLGFITLGKEKDEEAKVVKGHGVFYLAATRNIVTLQPPTPRVGYFSQFNHSSVFN